VTEHVPTLHFLSTINDLIFCLAWVICR